MSTWEFESLKDRSAMRLACLDTLGLAQIEFILRVTTVNRKSTAQTITKIRLGWSDPLSLYVNIKLNDL